VQEKVKLICLEYYFMGSNYQTPGTHSSTVIILEKERGNELFYTCKHIKLKVSKNSREATERSLVDPESGEKKFDFPTGADGLKYLEEELGDGIIEEFPIIFYKDFGVAIPNTKPRKKS
jgi:hypothetical protein